MFKLARVLEPQWLLCRKKNAANVHYEHLLCMTLFAFCFLFLSPTPCFPSLSGGLNQPAAGGRTRPLSPSVSSGHLCLRVKFYERPEFTCEGFRQKQILRPISHIKTLQINHEIHRKWAHQVWKRKMKIGFEIVETYSLRTFNKNLITVILTLNDFNIIKRVEIDCNHVASAVEPVRSMPLFHKTSS